MIPDDLFEKVKQAALDLEEKGYAVIEDVFSVVECEEIRAKMWAHLSDISDGFMTPDRDYANVRATDLFSHKHGIIESYRFNHLQVIKELRRNLTIIKIFALLLGSDQLTASIDRVNFKFPGRLYKSKETWPHADQDPRKLGRRSIQSYLTLLDCGTDSPGIRFYEGSHKKFEDYFKAKRDGWKDGDWNKLTGEEKVSLPLLCPLVKPTYRAGSMVLWDSRTVHDPDDGTDFVDGRFVVYLCYNKLYEKSGDEKFWAKKKAAFLDYRATSHSPIPQKMFAKCPRTYDSLKKGRYDEIPQDKLGHPVDGEEAVGAERFLFGFESYGGKEGKLLGDENWRQGLALPLLKFVSPFSPLAPSTSIKKKAEADLSVMMKKHRVQ